MRAREVFEAAVKSRRPACCPELARREAV